MTGAPLAARTGQTIPALHALTAAARRRWPTAVGLTAAAASITLALPLADPARAWAGAWWLLVAAVIYLTWGTVRGDLAQRGWLTAQTAAVLGFGAVALAAVALDHETGRFVLAAGWLGHAAWDLVHHHADRVVPRWYAETCMVIDLSVAAALITLGLV